MKRRAPHPPRCLWCLALRLLTTFPIERRASYTSGRGPQGLGARGLTREASVVKREALEMTKIQSPGHRGSGAEDARKCGMRISDCGMRIKRRNHGSTGARRTSHGTRITSHEKAYWPNEPIYGKGVVKPSVQGKFERSLRTSPSPSASVDLLHLSRSGGWTMMYLLPHIP